MVTLVNRAKVATATTGTGTITLGSAESGYQTFAAAGVANADVVRYVIEDGDDWEIGTGTYTTTGTTLTRTVSESSNADAAIVLTGSATVFIGATAEDIPPALYRDNASSATTPTASGDNAVAIGSQSEAAGSESFAAGFNATATAYRALALGHGANAGNTSVALGTSANASGSEGNALGRGATASGSESNALGHNSVATGTRSTAFARSYSSGVSALAAAIDNNTSTYGAAGSNSIAMGYRTKATGPNSVSISTQSITSGTGSAAIGGYGNVADATYSFASGLYADTNGIFGKMVRANGRFAATGDSQTGTLVLRSDTTDATAEALRSNSATADATNQIILPPDSAYFFSGTIIAREQASAGTDVGAWEIKGAIRREAIASSTVLIKSTIDDFNVPTGWAVALTADTTNGGLAITVTGAASTNIRWVATVNTSEVTY